MAIDIIGPGQNTANVTTSRPEDDREFGAVDTWFKDCTSPEAQDGTAIKAAILNAAIAQLRRAIRGMGIEENNADDDMLLKAIKKAGSQSSIINQFIAFLPIFPEVQTTDGKLALTASTGQIVINAGQTWVHRGAFQKTTDDYDLAARTFATVANKTYHLRWRWNGPLSAPAFYLQDLADSGYNPDADAETHIRFDTTFDDMLIAKIVTNGANALTVTALVNKAKLFQVVQFSGADIPGATYIDTTPGDYMSPDGRPMFTQSTGPTHTINWSRRPTIDWQYAFFGLRYVWGVQHLASRYTSRPLIYVSRQDEANYITSSGDNRVAPYYAHLNA